jgi:hypothetical protein
LLLFVYLLVFLVFLFQIFTSEVAIKTEEIDETPERPGGCPTLLFCLIDDVVSSETPRLLDSLYIQLGIDGGSPRKMETFTASTLVRYTPVLVRPSVDVIGDGAALHLVWAPVAFFYVLENQFGVDSGLGAARSPGVCLAIKLAILPCYDRLISILARTSLGLRRHGIAIGDICRSGQMSFDDPCFVLVRDG